ncbi:MAG TPA: Gfo/Idh/MocA family oxidoreductase [Firmicutes bacterium]|jgi:hypothetical protein|nr:Gfo/Idh/MocA family oxidoreductase [Bacillota bacterium]
MSELRLGMIGLDTSHATAFTDLLNLEDNPNHVKGGKVAVAFPGGSQEFSLSRDRVEKITQQLVEKHNIKLVDSVEAVAEESDAIFLESVDGRQHLEQFSKIVSYKKPVFIDKPLACSVADARAIFQLAKEHGTPVFSCSAIRYGAGIADVEGDRKVLGCESFGPMAILPDFPGLFWYGIHSAEVLFSKMGAGCVEVRTIRNETADVVVAKWNDGRMGTLYGYRIPKVGSFGATVLTDGGVFQSLALTSPPYYAKLLPKVIEFFNTGVSPVSYAEMLEITAFLEAATYSYETGEVVQLSQYGDFNV